MMWNLFFKLHGAKGIVEIPNANNPIGARDLADLMGKLARCRVTRELARDVPGRAKLVGMRVEKVERCPVCGDGIDDGNHAGCLIIDVPEK